MERFHEPAAAGSAERHGPHRRLVGASLRHGGPPTLSARRHEVAPR